MKKVTAQLRELLQSDSVILAPGAYDCLTAKAIESVGFPLIGTTGYGVHGSLLGKLDNGQVSFKEMLDTVTNIAAATTIPILADAENGYGNVINTVRTVKSFERAGLAGLFIEDQQFPPNCPFIKETQVIPVEEMCDKIRAAVSVREDPDFVIVARSDAPFEEAIERAEEYRKAGADMIKIVPKNRKELEMLPSRIRLPLHLGFISGTDVTAGLTAKDAGKMGYKIVSFPMVCLFSSCFSILTVLGELYQSGTDEQFQDMLTFDQYVNWLNIPT